MITLPQNLLSGVQAGPSSCGRWGKGSAIWRTRIGVISCLAAFERYLCDQQHGGVDDEQAAGPESGCRIAPVILPNLGALAPGVDIVGDVVDGDVGLSQNWADHRHLHCSPQKHWLVLPRCVEEPKVLDVDDMLKIAKIEERRYSAKDVKFSEGNLDDEVEEEDGADEGEGEGEDAGAGQQEEG